MLKDMVAAYRDENRFLREQLRLLRGQIYGGKSERWLGEEASRQMAMFQEPPAAEPEPEPEEQVIGPHRRKKPGRKPLPTDLPRQEVVHDLPEEEKVCGCGSELSRIGEEVSEQLDVEPAKAKVIRHIRPKYACKSCQGVDSQGPVVAIAPPPAQLLPKTMATPGLLAYLMANKFVDCLPFHRQEKRLARMGVSLSRATMCQWAMRVAEKCAPLIDLLDRESRSGPYVQMDETTLQVMREKGRKNTAKSYVWAIRAGPPDQPILRFHYHPSRSGQVGRGLLKDFRGVVQTDGYGGYDFLDHWEGVRHAGCLAHVRRKFAEIVKASGKKRAGRTSRAQQALAFIGKLYRIERDATLAGLDDEAKVHIRREQAKPILDEFREWLLAVEPTVPPKSLLGNAIAYALKQFPRLEVYLEAGYVKPDNNLVENAIRPLVMGRRNWLFSGDPKGATASTAMISLIETAKANGWEPYGYLRFLFENLIEAKTQEDYRRLLPNRPPVETPKA